MEALRRDQDLASLGEITSVNAAELQLSGAIVYRHGL